MAAKSSNERRWLERNKIALEPLREHTLAMLPVFEAQGLSNSTYGLARTRLAGPAWTALFDALAEASVQKASDLAPQHISNTAWAFATAKHASPALFDALAEASVQKASDLDPQAIANTAWAFATAKHASPALFDALAMDIARRGGVAALRDRRATVAITEAFEAVGVPLPRAEKSAKKRKKQDASKAVEKKGRR